MQLLVAFCCSISSPKMMCVPNSAISIHGCLLQCAADTSVHILTENRLRHRICSHESILQCWLFHLQRRDFMSGRKFCKTLAQKDERLLKYQARTTVCLSKSVALRFRDYLILWTWSINFVLIKCGKGQDLNGRLEEVMMLQCSHYCSNIFHFIPLS